MKKHTSIERDALLSEQELANAEFNFDEWHELAESDPEAFELRRQRWIEALIKSAPEHYQRRLKGIQFEVDMERERSETSIAATMRISERMWEHVVGPQGLLEQLDLLLHNKPLSEKKLSEGKVVSMQTRNTPRKKTEDSPL